MSHVLIEKTDMPNPSLLWRRYVNILWGFYHSKRAILSQNDG
jgi:hypothetical protein